MDREESIGIFNCHGHPDGCNFQTLAKHVPYLIHEPLELLVLEEDISNLTSTKMKR
jgi:hypothetical protein